MVLFLNFFLKFKDSGDNKESIEMIKLMESSNIMNGRNNASMKNINCDLVGIIGLRYCNMVMGSLPLGFSPSKWKLLKRNMFIDEFVTDCSKRSF